MKHFRSFLLFLTGVFALLHLQGCGSNPDPCKTPVSLITLAVPNFDGFGVTPDAVDQAVSVNITVSGSSGSLDTMLVGKPGEMALLQPDTSFQRPLKLKLAYKSADNQTIAEEVLRIDDTRKKGIVIPDMDVVVGVTDFPSCPGTSQSVSVSTTNGTSVFPWSPGDAFEVILTYSGTPYKFRVHPVEGTGDDAGTLTIYERPSQACLSDIDTQTVSTKEVAITTISNNCTVRAWNNGTTRTVTIAHAGASISVSK